MKQSSLLKTPGPNFPGQTAPGNTGGHDWWRDAASVNIVYSDERD